ncbi:TM0106 family RecB-like putative nuclease [Prochlorococcus sp. MIT 1341]|uniref:TM0106 family RecB-like putative nuclease n=1 Tax=Prochlorococcus sp. MIT 1341 TaxID=3096221 RepID=UPI002A7573AD|nr:TM0106 family RecB-like putative nuclease [Prochlorococcus sp. MIT 1341]
MGYTPSQPKVLTDRLLCSWVRCRRKAWLDRHGDATKRVWTPHRSLQLDQQHDHFKALLIKKPERGLRALREGAEGIIGLRIKTLDKESNSLEVHPALLQKTKGESRWGHFAYRPVISKQGRRLTREHRLSLAMTAQLLEPFQESAVTHGLALGSSNQGLEIEKVPFSKSLLHQLNEIICKLSKELEEQTPPPLTSDRKKCTLCSWRDTCSAQAAKEGYLSEVSGIGKARSKILKELGIGSLEALANADPKSLVSQLNSFNKQHGEVGEELIKQAKVQYRANPERLKNSLSIPELISAKGVLIYDIESDPDRKEDFLHGFLRIMKNNNGSWDIDKAQYHPLLIANLDDKSSSFCWERIQKKLTKYPKLPILHYGETEQVSLTRIAQKNGLSKKQIRDLQKRMIDVHKRLKAYWRLPINSYGLKTVAGWLGFHWRNERAEGARVLLWWRQFRKIKSSSWRAQKILYKIFEYNHDDNLATWEIVKWLVMQDKTEKIS